ncbi:unnamed protein product [Phytophthora fragariaefolia]|uniref:Unnamed protein product n=1 Tax=Phytophthora fragariaefolia TaxID=1490495 RepID=A0A9W6XB91_9STRA|nr:unnamed protein product [Phytophthora fragariaefolia]
MVLQALASVDYIRMSRLALAILVTLPALLLTSEGSSVFKVGATADANSEFINSKQQLRTATSLPLTRTDDEERGIASLVVSTLPTLLSKLKRSVGKLELQYNTFWSNRSLRKLEKMYRSGETPQKLALKYGPTKKAKLQHEYRKFHKWRSHWAKGRTYPRPNTVNGTPKLKRLR